MRAASRFRDVGLVAFLIGVLLLVAVALSRGGEPTYLLQSPPIFPTATPQPTPGPWDPRWFVPTLFDRIMGR